MKKHEEIIKKEVAIKRLNEYLIKLGINVEDCQKEIDDLKSDIASLEEEYDSLLKKKYISNNIQYYRNKYKLKRLYYRVLLPLSGPVVFMLLALFTKLNDLSADLSMFYGFSAFSFVSMFLLSLDETHKELKEGKKELNNISINPVIKEDVAIAQKKLERKKENLRIKKNELSLKKEEIESSEEKIIILEQQVDTLVDEIAPSAAIDEGLLELPKLSLSQGLKLSRKR